MYPVGVKGGIMLIVPSQFLSAPTSELLDVEDSPAL